MASKQAKNELRVCRGAVWEVGGLVQRSGGGLCVRRGLNCGMAWAMLMSELLVAEVFARG